MKHVWATLGMAGLLVACGGETPDGAEAGGTPGKDGGAGGGRHTVLVDALPDPCALLDTAAAQELLRVTEVFQKRTMDTPALQRGCTYNDEAGGAWLTTGLTLRMWSNVLDDTSALSEQEVRDAMVALMDDAELVAHDQSLGNHLFVFEEDDLSMVYVLTGVRGRAVMSDRLVSEAHLTVVLRDETRPPQERQALLRDHANKYYDALLAVSSLRK